MNETAAIQLGGVFWATTAVIGLGWLASVACIVFKYYGKKWKAFIVDDISRMTFTSVTLVLSIAVVINVSVAVTFLRSSAQQQTELLRDIDNQLSLTRDDHDKFADELQLVRESNKFQTLAGKLTELHAEGRISNSEATREIMRYLGETQIYNIDFRVPSLPHQFHCNPDPTPYCVTNG